MKKLLIGRLGQKDFLKGLGILIVAYVVVTIAYLFCLRLLSTSLQNKQVAAAWIGFVLDLILSIPLVSMLARRFHDLGKSHASAFYVTYLPILLSITMYILATQALVSAPEVNLNTLVQGICAIVIIYLAFTKSQTVDNKYGSPILLQSNKTKILFG